MLTKITVFATSHIKVRFLAKCIKLIKISKEKLQNF